MICHRGCRDTKVKEVAGSYSGLPIKTASRIMCSSFSGLSMGTMGHMDILHADMWRRHPDLNKED